MTWRSEILQVRWLEFVTLMCVCIRNLRKSGLGSRVELGTVDQSIMGGSEWQGHWPLSTLRLTEIQTPLVRNGAFHTAYTKAAQLTCETTLMCSILVLTRHILIAGMIILLKGLQLLWKPYRWKIVYLFTIKKVQGEWN